MTRQWVNPFIRCLVYLYFAAGMALLVFGGMPSALRYSADRTLPATLLLITGGGIFGLLAFGNWEKFGRQISRRRWILLCILSSLGFVVLIFAPTSYGGSGA
jgi:membrane protease YdiL (CAAX protease family)